MGRTDVGLAAQTATAALVCAGAARSWTPHRPGVPGRVMGRGTRLQLESRRVRTNEFLGGPNATEQEDSGGSREVAESYLASTIAARVRLLEECVISLRFAQNRTAPISPSVDPHRVRAGGRLRHHDMS